ncbi:MULTISPECIES: TonB-dependent siderophore receptor [unclassified Lentimonas]|uniref:TonB-dependent siderophore receptor n=1 Tax=unclassified Lentimonas TaxID=2630993 RepID=UPI0013206EA1|nr:MULTISPECIES: TonB-dependent receptor [unclassified Lentimonas]CAA6676301.1 Unannotated [Lentimonas sp. CC4]CAA6683809.1 Unannotated [Lentimonas sp. CC6]CAA7077794.1 Unannotated [Lentimonas sp. CC4]CAA7169726.1 Unannotated [Lentimonas sp. CC21]CAA7179548.1 Unannotated [Lentimonas sp. CC8]
MSKYPNITYRFYITTFMLACSPWLCAQAAADSGPPVADDVAVPAGFVLPDADDPADAYSGEGENAMVLPEGFVLPEEDEDATDASADTDEGEFEDEDGEEVYVLPEFVVSAEKDQGYYSAHSLAGTRTSELIKNTPLTIGVINEELINDFGLNTIDDLASVLAGVQTDANDGFNNRVLRFRGFKSNSQTFEFMPRVLDQDNYNVARSEIIRGSNSLIYGQSDPGGKVNYIAKRAEFGKNKGRVSTTIEDDGSYRGEFDYNQVINEKVATRVMGVYSYKDLVQDEADRTFQGMTVETSYRATENTQFRLHLEGAKADRTPIANWYKDGTSEYGTTGPFRNLPFDDDLVDYLPNSMVQDMINFNDGTLETTDLRANGTPNSKPVLDFFESKQDIKNLYKSIDFDPDDIGDFEGDDEYRDSEGFFALGEMMHSFTENLNLKFAFAIDSEDTDSETINLGTVKLATNKSYDPDRSYPYKGLGRDGEPNPISDAKYLGGNGSVEEAISGAHVGARWVKNEAFEDTYSTRTTFSWHKDIAESKQQFLFSYDFDYRDVGKKKKDPYYTYATPGADGIYSNSDKTPILNYRFDGVDTGNYSGDSKWVETNKDTAQIETHALWFANQGTYTDGRLHTLLGVRVDMIDVSSENDRTAIKGYENGKVKTDDTYTEWSPSIGALFWFHENVAVFANYSTSVQSPTGFDRNPEGEILDPEKGKGYEVGFKFELLDGKLNGELVGFSIKKENDINSLNTSELQGLYPNDGTNDDLYDQTDGSTQFVGNRLSGIDVQSQGVELMVFYNPISAVSLSLGYAYLDTEIKDHPLDYKEGNTQNGTAPHTVTFTGRYSFKDGLLKGGYFGGSMKYIDKALYDTYELLDGGNAELWLDDHFETSLFAGWSCKMGKSQEAPKLSLKVIVKNVFDEVSYVAKSNGAQYTNPRTFGLQAAVDF